MLTNLELFPLCSAHLSNCGGGGDSKGLNWPRYCSEGKVIDCMCRGLYFLFKQKTDASAIRLSVTKLHVNMIAIQRRSNDTALNSLPPSIGRNVIQRSYDQQQTENYAEGSDVSGSVSQTDRLAISQSTSIS